MGRFQPVAIVDDVFQVTRCYHHSTGGFRPEAVFRHRFANEVWGGKLVKVAFALDVEDGWPPVATEHVWCEKTGAIYELRNAPFFVKGLALGDKFAAEPDAANGCVFEFTTVEPSGHSLVWIAEQEGLELEPYKDELVGLGLSIEAFSQFKHYAVDVPASSDAHEVNTMMDVLQQLGFAMAFPVWRH